MADDDDQSNSEEPSQPVIRNAIPSRSVDDNLAPSMQIFVKTLSGLAVTLEVHPFWTIGKVKTVLQSAISIEAGIDDMKMVFAGKVLENFRSLAQYMIQKESTLHLVVNVRGGAEPRSIHIDWGLGDGEAPDENVTSLQDILKLQTCASLIAQSKFQPKRVLSKDLIDLTADLDVVESCKSIRSGIVELEFSKRFQSWGELLIEESLRCSEEIGLQFGQIKVEMLKIENELGQFVHKRLLPNLSDEEQSNKTYDLEMIVFHDGISTFFDNNTLSLAPNTWDVQGSHRALPEHKDMCDLTINICLGSHEFSGGQIEFCGNPETMVYQHKKGHAVIHSGEELHRVTPTLQGDRFNLLLFLHKRQEL
jgi:hypothetical protein